MSQGRPYVGRFAPSPTGRLHLGSMVAAVASWLDARAAGGTWLVRMEDLDPPREVPGAADDILRTLEGFGLLWDGAVWRQSTRDAAYAAALSELDRAGWAFGCACTRKEMAAANGLSVYSGTCRNGVPAGKRARSWRFRMAGNEPLTWVDAVQGPQRVHRADVGDVVLRRADGFWAYHLAVVVDDLAQGVSDVVRGADLLEATAAHLAVYEALKGAGPRYAHLPVVTNSQGQKLSKQTLAWPVETANAPHVLSKVLAHLGQPEVALDAPHRMLAQAALQWDIRTVPQGSREGG